MSYEAAEWATLRHGLAMTFSQRLDWLEQAGRLAESLRSQRADGGEKPRQESANEDVS
jgi:hypothetical protein